LEQREIRGSPALILVQKAPPEGVTVDAETGWGVWAASRRNRARGICDEGHGAVTVTAVGPGEKMDSHRLPVMAATTAFHAGHGSVLLNANLVIC
jgi:hypothetical protein